MQFNNNGEMCKGYREDGYFPEAFINMLALLGWNPGTEQEIFSMDELIKEFTIERVGKSGSRFDPDKTKWFNHQYIMKKSAEEVAELFRKDLDTRGIDYSNFDIVRICELMKERISFIHEMWDETRFFFETPTHFDEKFKKKSCKEDTAEVLETLITILDKCPDFKPETTEGAVKAWIEGNEWGFGKVMSPFRLAIVGEGKGPSVFDMIEVIGKDETLKRIENLVKELRSC